MNQDDPDIQITNTDDEKKSGFAWTKLAWGIAALVVAGLVFQFFIRPRLNDTTHSAAAKVAEPVPSTPEAEVEAKTDTPSEEEKPSNDNDAYCASIASSQDKTDRLYCDSLLPEARKVDERIEKLEKGGGSTDIPAWLIVTLIVLAASQVFTWTMLAKKRNKD